MLFPPDCGICTSETMVEAALEVLAKVGAASAPEKSAASGVDSFF